MATLLGRWTHRFIDGDPPVEIVLRPFTFSDWMATERERGSAEAEQYAEAVSMAMVTAMISRCVVDVRGLAVLGVDGDAPRGLRWPTDAEEIVEALQGEPEAWGRLVAAFRDRRKRAEGKS